MGALNGKVIQIVWRRIYSATSGPNLIEILRVKIFWGQFDQEKGTKMS